MSSAPSDGDDRTVQLASAPFRVDPGGIADSDTWLPPAGPPPTPRVYDASSWDDTALCAALRRIPAIEQLAPGEPAEVVRIGRLELVARIGAGGMGEVYVARDLELDRQVAVKLVRPGLDSGDATMRIMREAQMMARVTHPNVVRIYDVGRLEARIYITMEYVPGATLREWLERAPRSWREIVEVFIRAGRGLAAAHRTGLVHRDFKPSNVLVGADERVLVADFGLARCVAGEPETDRTSAGLGRMHGSSSGNTPQVTMQGAILGTPGYMSPEQLRAAPVDGRSDLFSFCVALHEALHGARPFAGRDFDSLLANIDAGVFSPPTRRPKLPTPVARAIHRGLAADPARRFASMEALLAVLERALRSPAKMIAGSVGLTAALVGGAAFARVGPFDSANPCAAAGAELGEVWNDARKQALRAEFTATGLDFAGAAWARVSDRLDAYAAAWTRARVDTCEATEVRHTQSAQLFDLRIACLERRRQGMRALVDALTPADRTTVEQAVASVSSLPELDPCNDAEWLGRSLRPPESAEVAIAVAGAREAIGRAEALHATGHYREGLAHATAIADKTREIAYEPVHAEALQQRGRLLAAVGALVDAEATLLAAVELAEANRHDELAADLWLDLMRLTNRYLIDPSRGAAWIQRARAAQRRLGDPPARRVRVLYEQAMMHYHQYDYPACERLLRTGLALHDEVGGDPYLRGRLLHNLANTLRASGQRVEARATFATAIEALAASVGTDHPDYARVAQDFALFLTASGELDEAGVWLQVALDINTRTFGATHQQIGRAHIALVDLSLRREDFERAITHAESAVRILGEALPPDHPDLVDAQIALGTARFFGGELEAALTAFLRARELQRRVSPPDPILLAITACDIGETEAALGRHAAARTSFAEVERLLARAPTRDLDLEARVFTGRGKLALAAGDPHAAVPLLEAAVDLRRQLPDDPLALAELHEALVQARAG